MCSVVFGCMPCLRAALYMTKNHTSGQNVYSVCVVIMGYRITTTLMWLLLSGPPWVVHDMYIPGLGYYGCSRDELGCGSMDIIWYHLNYACTYVVHGSLNIYFLLGSIPNLSTFCRVASTITLVFLIFQGICSCSCCLSLLLLLPIEID